MTSTKTVRARLLAIGVAAGFVAAGATTPASAGSPLPATAEDRDEWVIGWINPLSGSAATFGELSRNAIDIAVDEINDDGGILGAPLRVQYEDNEFLTDVSVTAAERLADRGVRVIVTAGSAVVFALDPVAVRRDLLIANIGAQSPQLAETERTYSFIPTSSAEVEVLAGLAVERLAAESVAIIHVDSDYGEDSADAFIAEFEELGGEIVAREIHDVGSTDVRTQLIQIRGEDPDAILIVSNITEVGHIARQAREIGIEAQLLGVTFALSPDNFEIAGEAMDGMRGVAVAFQATTNDRAASFAEAFEDVAGFPPAIYSATSYDAINILAGAIEETGTDDPEAIAGYLTGLTDYEGVLGPTSFGEDRAVEIELFVWEIVDGEAQPWGE